MHRPISPMPLLFRCAICLAASLCCVAANAADWQVVKQQGRDYVTFDSLAKFYQFAEYTHVNRTVSLRADRRGIRAQSGTSEIYINGVRFFTDYPILSSNNEELISAVDVSKIVEPVLRPNKIKNTTKVETVVLDPGHGGTDNGTSNQWGSEKQFALDVALAAREQLLRAGYKVEMTRSGDTGVSLEDRVKFANQFENAVFISIHFNSSNGGAGVESYALAPAGVVSNAAAEGLASADVQWHEGNARDEQNIALAAAVHATVLSRVSTFDRGVRHARFHVLRDVKIPAVLLEGGFLSNLFEGQRVATPQHRQQLGIAIAQAVQNYDRAVNFKSSATPTFAAAASNLPPHERSITEPLTDERPAASGSGRQPSVDVTGAH
jgi:N-acetylmuramoyl-L-alanine amidase